MKIVFVCHDAALTGAPKVGFEIAKNLSVSNEVVMVVKKDGVMTTLSEYCSGFSKIINSNTSHEISNYTYHERMQIAVNILKTEKPDLLYVNSVASSDWCEAAKMLAIPVALHCHEMENELKSLESIEILKRNLPGFVDLLITVSAESERDIKHICTMPFKKVLHSKPGVNANMILSQAEIVNLEKPKNIFGQFLDNKKPLISMCGTASKRKGSDIFLKVAQNLPEFNFLWIGPWDNMEAEGNIAFESYQTQKLSNFFLTNRTLNPYPYFKLTDVFILTSREDPNPLVVMEALLLSKICIGFSNTGGSKDILSRFGVLLHGTVDPERITSILRNTLKTPLKPLLNAQKLQDLKREIDIDHVYEEIYRELQAFSKN